jgi:hypothetical protein
MVIRSGLFIPRGVRAYPFRQWPGARQWIAAVEAKTAYIAPGSAWENGFTKSFDDACATSSPAWLSESKI